MTIFTADEKTPFQVQVFLRKGSVLLHQDDGLKRNARMCTILPDHLT